MGKQLMDEGSLKLAISAFIGALPGTLTALALYLEKRRAQEIEKERLENAEEEGLSKNLTERERWLWSKFEERFRELEKKNAETEVENNQLRGKYRELETLMDIRRQDYERALTNGEVKLAQLREEYETEVETLRGEIEMLSERLRRFEGDGR